MQAWAGDGVGCTFPEPPGTPWTEGLLEEQRWGWARVLAIYTVPYPMLSPDDGTPFHGPRHRTCFTQTLSRFDPLVVRYQIHNRHATSSISHTKSRHTSRRAHHRLPFSRGRQRLSGGEGLNDEGVTLRSGRI